MAEPVVVRRPHRRPTPEQLAAYRDTLYLLEHLISALPTAPMLVRSFVVLTAATAEAPSSAAA